MSSETGAESPAPEQFPTRLLIKAEMGRLTDPEAEVIMRHPGVLRSLSRYWDECPPSTRMLADLISHGTAGALEVLRRAHLDQDNLRALQTIGRLEELRELREVAPETVSWMSRTEGSYFTSFNPQGQQETNPLEVGVDKRDKKPYVDVSLQAVAGQSDPDLLILTTGVETEFACTTLIYGTGPSLTECELLQVAEPVIFNGEFAIRSQETTLRHRVHSITAIRVFTSSPIGLRIPPPARERPRAASVRSALAPRPSPAPQRRGSNRPIGDRVRDR